MRVTGITDLPLHGGSCPPWLFNRMKGLAREISRIIIYEYGRREFIKRLSDPFFFQSLSCVLGFDWHSSGTTTVTTAVLKESISLDLGIAVCGGKGKRSRATPEEIEKAGSLFSLSSNKLEKLKEASKLSAKVDNILVQDDHNLYHHSFIFSEEGDWIVIQQGMNENVRTARRYHWASDNLNSFVEEPHTGIIADRKFENVLNLVSKKSRENRKTILDLVKDNPKKIKTYVVDSKQVSLNVFLSNIKYISMPWKINWNAIYQAYELQPRRFEEFLSIKGIGPSTVRALALISELIFGKPADWKDPAKYSYAHGGKDGVPYRVNLSRMEKTTEILRDAIQNAEIGNKEKINALKRLTEFISF